MSAKISVVAVSEKMTGSSNGPLWNKRVTSLTGTLHATWWQQAARDAFAQGDRAHEPSNMAQFCNNWRDLDGL